MKMIYIHKIDTARLPDDAYVFDAESLAAKLQINHLYADDEFIFLYCIPGNALRHTWELGEIEEEGASGAVAEDENLS